MIAIDTALAIAIFFNVPGIVRLRQMSPAGNQSLVPRVVPKIAEAVKAPTLLAPNVI